MSLTDRIAELHRLHSSGSLTDDEFAAAKRVVLAESSQSRSSARPADAVPSTGADATGSRARRPWLFVAVGVMVLFVALASAWVLGTSGGDETLTADPSDRDVTPSAAPTPAPSGTPSPTLGEEPPPAPAAPSETTRTDAECKQLMDDLVLDQGLPSAVAYPTLRQEGCGVWLDEQLAAAQTAQP